MPSTRRNARLPGLWHINYYCILVNSVLTLPLEHETIQLHNRREEETKSKRDSWETDSDDFVSTDSAEEEDFTGELGKKISEQKRQRSASIWKSTGWRL